MAYSAKVGSFNIDSSITAGNDQAITGVGFQPKIVLFWWSGSTATGDSVAGATLRQGFGAGISSTSRFCVANYEEDAAATVANHSSHDSDAVIVIWANASGGIDGIADFKSLDADGFTLTIDNQFAADYRISFLALGGTDLTNVALGFQAAPAGTGNYNITGVGFQPEAVILVSANIGSADAVSGNVNFVLGMATGSSNQGVVDVYAQGAQATTNTSRYGYNGETFSRVILTDVYERETFVSFGADGFTLNCLERTITGQGYFYICLAGGQYLVGDLTTRTDGNDIVETTTFQPVAVLFASVNRAVSTQDVASDHARLSIGAGTSATERAVHAISDEDNLADTEAAYTNQDDAVYAHVVDDAIVALMDIKSIEADGFTCVMDDVEDSACWVTYLAIGAAAGGAPSMLESMLRPRVIRSPRPVYQLQL